MFNWFKGDMPDITPAQMVAGIPLLANLLSAYGVWSPTAAQQSTLKETIIWAAALFAGDAILRAGRNVAKGLAKKPPAH